MQSVLGRTCRDYQTQGERGTGCKNQRLGWGRGMGQACVVTLRAPRETGTWDGAQGLQERAYASRVV